MKSQQNIPCYGNGRPFKPMLLMDSPYRRPWDCRGDRVIALAGAAVEWPRFWQIVSTQLQKRGYAQSSIALYRSVLRSFYRFIRCRPGQVTAGSVSNYIDELVRRHYSWSWLGINISVIRSVFDKLGGMATTARLRTPKRPKSLPVILGKQKIIDILTCATTTRDQLLLGLLYGSALKPGEACQLRWRDFDLSKQSLTINFDRNRRSREVPLAPDLMAVLTMGVERCAPDAYVFQGRASGTHLSTRMIELIVRKAARAAGVLQPTTAMTLRHSAAVHCLEANENVRSVQEFLGHKSIETTLMYERCMLPEDSESPLSLVKAIQDSVDPLLPHTAAKEPPAVSVPNDSLFHQVPTIEPIQLPFAPAARSSLFSQAAQFYDALRVQIVGRFLGLRQSNAPPGPPRQ